MQVMYPNCTQSTVAYAPVLHTPVCPVQSRRALHTIPLMQTNSTGDTTTCTFMGNTALNGGGVYQNMASGSILRAAFTNNVAGQKGGAVYGETSTGNMMNSTFTGNRASQAGGAGVSQEH